jgi:GxxExxY protein
VQFFVRRKKEIRKKMAGMNATEAEQLISTVIDVGFHIHNELGPGLLESLYEAVMQKRIEALGHDVKRQHPVDVTIDGMKFADAYRVDLLINGWLAVELKAVERLGGVHVRQALTYVKLLQQPIGLLINFGCESYRDSVRRIYNNR